MLDSHCVHVTHILIVCIIRFVNLIHSQTDTMNGIEGIILDQHNVWRSLITNGDIDDQPSGANIEKLLWEYEIQQMAYNFTHKCNADLRPMFDIDILNNTDFSFEADFEKFAFGYNTAFIQYNKDFDFSKEQQLFNITKDLINKWFQENEEYDFGDPVSDKTTNYFNAAGGVTRYIGCAITPCNIFICDADRQDNCCPVGVCIRYMYLNCFYFPSVTESLAISDENGLYNEGISCTECSIDRDNMCDNGLCAGCPSHEWYRCQNDNSCDQFPGDPCQHPEFAKNCPMSCDDSCRNLNGSNDSICFNQPQSPTPVPTVNPTFNPTKTPSLSPSRNTVNPTINPTLSTLTPTINPTLTPSINPTITPSQSPTKQPSISPSILPTIDPTDFPTVNPSNYPTISPAANPTNSPITHSPTVNGETLLPSKNPTINPTKNPTINPTINPTKNPSKKPSINPTITPSINPTINPTKNPTINPSIFPSISPTINPSQSPIKQPSLSPTLFPTADPVDSMTLIPTNYPTTNSPLTRSPTIRPHISTQPSPEPSTHSPTTISPSQIPTNTPLIATDFPSETPTNFPSETKSTLETPAPTNSQSTISPSLNPTSIPSETPIISPLTSSPTIKISLPTHSPNTIHSKPPSKPPTLLPTPLTSTKLPSESDGDSGSSDDKPDYDYQCGINFLPFSEYTKCTNECNGGKKKRTRLVYYYGCYSNTITYLGKQVVSKECNTHKCNVE